LAPVRSRQQDYHREKTGPRETSHKVAKEYARLMSRRTIDLTPSLYEYLLRVGTREPEVLQQLREETAKLPTGSMQIAPEQGQLLRFLVRILRVEKALEVGVFTGYSGLCVALELPASGVWIGCDSNPETTAVARRYFELAGVGQKFDVRLGLAKTTLEGLLASGHGESFDFVFIDADKESYETYYELSLALLRRGGVVAFDNVLWGGAVADPARTDAQTQAIRATNLRIQADARVAMVLLPLGDGVMLATKL
jgi:predicted O-methyltransferase YrrM